MSEFFVGQKVVCVVPKPFGPMRQNEAAPVHGGVYTIREFHPDRDAIRVAEILNPPNRYNRGHVECSFMLDKFRPLESKAIQLFRDIAAGVSNGSPIIPDDQDAYHLTPAILLELIGGGWSKLP